MAVPVLLKELSREQSNRSSKSDTAKCDLLAHAEIRKPLRRVYVLAWRKIQALEMMKRNKLSEVSKDD